MTVSVAIATYNRAGMVREAIEAALRQTRVPDEIVVSDDASTDATAAMLDEIAARDRRVRVIRRAENSGGVGNWNAAMRATRGEIIAWCSDDDRFTPDHLEASIEFLRANPGIGVVHSSFIDAIEMADTHAIRAARPLRSVAPITVSGDAISGYMTRYYDWPFHPSTIVMRRAVWERTGPFDPRYALADTDWFVRAAAATEIAMLPRHGAINRRHAGNWSNRVGSAAMQREIFEIVEKAIAKRAAAPRALWRALWRANVRARLALTLGARMRSGHAGAACAAWHGILQDTGRRMPEWIERAGARIIRRTCEGREPAFKDARESVSPL
jgi:glycosyltransferase involved in cell wall biosynthesis